jgi:hypothetical protein
LTFAFGNESGGAIFANNFGPSNSMMPNTLAGDAAFAAAATNAIFASATTTNTSNAIFAFVENWKTFYTNNGIPGNVHPSSTQIDIAARGAAWGDAVGIALANNLGPIPAQVANFLEDAAHGTAIYGASLTSQPSHVALQNGATASVALDNAGNLVGLLGVATPIDSSTI